MSKTKLLSSGYHVTDIHKTEDGNDKEIFAMNTSSDVYVNEERNTLDDFLPTITSNDDPVKYPIDAIQDGDIEAPEAAVVALLS